MPFLAWAGTAAAGISGRHPDGRELTAANNALYWQIRALIRTRSEQGIDKRRNRRALRQNNQGTQQQHDNNNGGQPEFLSDFHERPEVFQ
jgi:hypothetical protein